MKISILLVTYNRKELLDKALNNIERHAQSANELIIVDNNSTDSTLAYLSQRYKLESSDLNFSTDISGLKVYKASLDKMSITVVALDKNTGGSGGFYTGLKYFNEFSSNDWVWGMDDDAFIQPNALERLNSTIMTYNKHKAFWSNCNNDTNFVQEVKSVKSWMFVGFCIHRELIEEIGLPVSDYFIYHDDTEYAERIIRHGHEILKVRDSVIEHGDFSHRRSWKRKILFKELSFPEMQDWKLYYYFRNDILKSSHSKMSKLKKTIKLSKVAIKVSLIRPEKIGLVSKAMLHGVKNKRGVFIRP